MTESSPNTSPSILRHPDLKNVTAADQWLYFTALGEGPRRCGIVDVWPKRYSQLAAGVTEDMITGAANELDRAGLVFFDEETDEMLFPGYLTEVTNVNNPRMMIAVVNSLTGVVSQKLVGLVVWELQQLREQNPAAKVWDDGRVIEALKRPAVDPEDLRAGK